MGLITNKIYICLPFEKEIDKLDWDGLSTEEYNGKPYYKIPSGGNSSDVVKKITFETLKDNVTVTLNIVSSSEARYDYAYASVLDGTPGYNNAKYEISGNNQSITHEYVVPTKGSHWIYIGYRKDGSGNSYNDCGYFSIDNSDKEYVIRQPKEVYLASDKMNEITYGSKKIFEHGFNNIIKWTGKRYNPKENLYMADAEVSLAISYSYTDYAINPYGQQRKGVAYLYDGNINSYYDLNKLYFWKEPKCKNIELKFSYDNNYSPLSNNIFKIPSSIDLSNVDFSRISYIDNLFYGWKGLNSIKLPDDFAKGKKSLRKLFNGSLNYYRNDGNNNIKSLDVANWDTSYVTDMSRMFDGCAYLTSIDVSKWNTSNVTNMSNMFTGCKELTNIDVSGFDTSNVTDMTYMFGSILDLYGGPYNYLEFNNINLNNINTSNVTNMSYMFCGCKELTNIDVSGFDTSKVAYMSGIFNVCSSLTTVDVSNWDTSKVTDMTSLFKQCTSLTYVDVSNWDVSKVTSMNNIFYNCQKLSALDLSNWDISNINYMNEVSFYICKELTTLIDGHEHEPDVVALNGLRNSIDFRYSTKLNYESVYALFRGVATVTTTQTITLPKVMEGNLDPAKVKIATDKGWTIAYK